MYPDLIGVIKDGLYKDIKSSKLWGNFYQAVRDRDYDGFLEISEVFCHV
jgi:hypothetical protein